MVGVHVRRRLGVVLGVVLLTAACGTTVPVGAPAGQEPQAVDELGFDPAEDRVADPAGGPSGDAGAGDDIGGAPAGGGTPDGEAPAVAEPPAGNGVDGPRPGVVGGPDGHSSSGDPRQSANTTPLKIGIAYLDNSSTESSVGFQTDTSINGKRAAQAFVKGINAAGGLNGRELRPVEYSWDTSGTNYSRDASVACEKFTKDNRVEVVLDSAFGTIGGFAECLQRAGVLHVTGAAEGDRVSSQARPLHANTRSMVDDRAYSAVLSNLTATGYLSRASQLGVILEQCPHLERAYEKSISPLIRKLGLKSPVVRTLSCTTGFDSATGASSAISGAILAFRNAGVDRVMFVSDYESVVLLLFGPSASSQRYFPGYALSSNAQAEVIRPNIPEDQWPQLHGVGSSPGGDVADRGTPPTPVEARCLEIAKRGGISPATPTDRSFVYYQCSLFLLLETALERTGGDSTPAELQAAINGLGTSFASPGMLVNSTKFSRDRHDGPDAVQVFGYVPSCTCLRYSGRPQSAPA